MPISRLSLKQSMQRHCKEYNQNWDFNALGFAEGSPKGGVTDMQSRHALSNILCVYVTADLLCLGARAQVRYTVMCVCVCATAAE